MFTSGSKFLKTYILVFSIMANKSGLSLAHFMSQTSLRSSFSCSPASCCPTLSAARASRSRKVSTPARSMIARRLQKNREKIRQLNDTTQGCKSDTVL